MGNALQRIFNPTKEELQEQYDRINAIIRDIYEKYGECCATCKHERTIQASPYYDYATCEYDKTIEFGFGEGDKEHRCEKYEFCGYLKVKEK